MLPRETAKKLLIFVNNQDFCDAWKEYIDEFIKNEDLNIERYATGDINVFTSIARKKMLKEFLIMPERVREKAK